MSDDKNPRNAPPLRGDVRSGLDKPYLYSYDLQGREVTVVIERVVQGELTGQQGKLAKKPVVFFKGKAKPLALNITNIKTIGAMYGSFRAEDWIGKAITLYPTTTNFGSETRDCIRVRPKKPTVGATKEAEQPAAPVEREPGSDDEAEDKRNRRLAAPTDEEMP